MRKSAYSGEQAAAPSAPLSSRLSPFGSVLGKEESLKTQVWLARAPLPASGSVLEKGAVLLCVNKPC